MTKVTVYVDNNMRVYAEMKLKVDEDGEEWLSADQVDYLEQLRELLISYNNTNNTNTHTNKNNNER